MLAVHCPRHASDVLLSARQVTAIDGRGHDMTIHYTCHCGHHGTHRPRARPPATAA